MRQSLWGCGSALVRLSFPVRPASGGRRAAGLRRATSVGAIALLALAVLPLASALAASKDRPTPVPAPSPTIVKELIGLRSATSSTFLMSNGERRARISAVPVHFKDAAGNWQDFDTTLVPGSAAGSYTTKATPFAVNLLSDPQGAAAATLSYEGYTIGFRLSDASEAGGLAGPSELTFPAIAASASESYRIVPAGLEQSLSLASPAAPTSFTCEVSHVGLALRRDKQGSWGFYAPGSDTALLCLSSLLVYDSSHNAGGLPAFCSGAAMTVKAGVGLSTLTYTVPHAWLASAARVYPVTIDPMAYFATYFSNIDTAISSAAPNTAFGTASQLTVGNDGAGYWRSLLYFDTSAIPTTAYVHSTDLELYKSYSGGSNAATHLGALNEPFSGSSTWNSLGCAINSFPTGFASDLGTVTAGSAGWQSFWEPNLDYTVQKWVSGARPNDGLALWQDESGAQGAAYLARYYSYDYGADPPYLWVEYEDAPQATVSLDSANYRLGDTVSATMTVNAVYYWDLNEMQLQIDGGGNPANYHGRLGWFMFDPNATHADGVSWVTRPVSCFGETGYLAYEAPPGNTFGTQYITPDLDDSSEGYSYGTYQVVWKFSLNAGSPQFGNLQANSFSTGYAMDPDGPVASAGTESYSSGWQNQATPTFDLKAVPVTALAFTTTANATWWNPSSGNDDTNGSGRGSVTLSWPASPGADGYYVEAWDGYQYD